MTTGWDEDPGMTELERRCRALLLAYPATYRRERGEEMLSTLLETNSGRAWPMPRDTLALVLGGLRSRSEQDRRGTVTDLRLAALLGCSIFLSTVAASYASQGLWSQYPWQPLAAATLTWAAALAPFLAGRRVVAALAALAVAANFVRFEAGYWDRGTLLAAVIPLLLLALLSGAATRPPRLWLWLPGLVVGTTIFGQVLATTVGWKPAVLWTLHTPLAIVLIGVASVWIAVDARPATAVAVAFFAIQFLTTFQFFVQSAEPTSSQPTLERASPGFYWIFESPLNWALTSGFQWQWVAPAVPLTALALWRIRRQVAL